MEGSGDVRSDVLKLMGYGLMDPEWGTRLADALGHTGMGFDENGAADLIREAGVEPSAELLGLARNPELFAHATALVRIIEQARVELIG